jgi:hypothetical protein
MEPNKTMQSSSSSVAVIGAGIIGVSCVRRVKFDVASYTNDRRATVEFSKKVAGAMARHAARIAYERAGGR